MAAFRIASMLACAAALSVAAVAARAQTTGPDKPAPARPEPLNSEAAKPEGQKPQPPRPETRKPTPPPASKPQQAAPAAAKPPAQPEAAQAPAPVAVAGPGELQPVLHARDANLAMCMDHVVTLSASAIDTRHTAASTWSTAAPDANPFTSIVGLSYNNQTTPNGLAILISAPLVAGRCGGGVIQIYPTSNSCSVVQAALIKRGKTLGSIEKLPLVETGDGVRNILMPTVGGGCTVVSVRL